MGKKKQNISWSKNSNVIVINKMDHPSCVTSFIRTVNSLIKRGQKEIVIECKCERNSIFPDACLPISALIQNYQRIYDIKFEIHESSERYLNNCSFANPLCLSVEELEKCRNPLDKIFMYTSEPGYEKQIPTLVQAYIDCISRIAKCEDGVLSGLTWCINEVMDNVLVHSRESTGYIMAQYHKKKKKLVICVFDCGIGIYNSLSNSDKHKPVSEIDSLTMAIQEGIGDGKGQGNGLYGLYQIVEENGGKLSISSGESAIMLKNGELKKYEDGCSMSTDHAGTIVDFQLNLSKEIDIKSALKSLGGYEAIDIRIENMLQDDNWLRYDVYDNCCGTGTRKAGEELRNDVINTIVRSKTPVILDFSKVKTCSSSFIDEFIAKLVADMGIVEFNRSIKLDNMNELVSHLCERSIDMRIHEKWESHIEAKQK